jgi:hypothetical protein
MTARVGTIAALVLVAAACDAGRSDDEGGGVARKDEAESASNAEDLVDAGAGTTWTDLYRDLFGPTAPASCAGTGMCHGTADESGARGSNGYVCTSREGCRESMLSLETGIVQPSDSKAPEKSTLIAMLRRRSASGGIVGTMPKRSEYVFSRDSIARVETWIRNGAPND